MEIVTFRQHKESIRNAWRLASDPEPEPKPKAPENPAQALVQTLKEIFDAETITKAALKNMSKKIPLAGRILCPYKGTPRYINAHVCKWHRDAQDPECFRANCSRVKNIRLEKKYGVNKHEIKVERNVIRTTQKELFQKQNLQLF